MPESDPDAGVRGNEPEPAPDAGVRGDEPEPDPDAGVRGDEPEPDARAGGGDESEWFSETSDDDDVKLEPESSDDELEFYESSDDGKLESETSSYRAAFDRMMEQVGSPTRPRRTRVMFQDAKGQIYQAQMLN